MKQFYLLVVQCNHRLPTLHASFYLTTRTTRTCALTKAVSQHPPRSTFISLYIQSLDSTSSTTTRKLEQETDLVKTCPQVATSTTTWVTPPTVSYCRDFLLKDCSFACRCQQTGSRSIVGPEYRYKKCGFLLRLPSNAKRMFQDANPEFLDLKNLGYSRGITYVHYRSSFFFFFFLKPWIGLCWR